MGRLSNSSHGLAKVLVSHNWSRRLSRLLPCGLASPHDRLVISLAMVVMVVSTTTFLVVCEGVRLTLALVRTSCLVISAVVVVLRSRSLWVRLLRVLTW
jgi:hypothetical protein